MRTVLTVSRAILVVAVVAALSGCAANSSPASSPAASAPVESKAFAFAAVAGADTGAFVTITNAGSQANKLIGVTSTVTDRAELHTVEKDAAGEMMMKQVANIDVPAAGVLELKPGSFHVMLFGLTAELKVGDSFPITLKYEQGGESTVQFLVQERN